MNAKKSALIQTAIRLFSEYGYYATGVNQIARESGVTKKTLYRHFNTKEDLIVAALRHHDIAFRKQFILSVETAAQSPNKRMLAIFDVAGQWFEENHFFGCMFISAASEFTVGDNEIREVCRQYKNKMTAYFSELAEQAGAKNPDHLALQLALLLEGAIVIAQVSGSSDSAHRARFIAETLIDQQLSRL